MRWILWIAIVVVFADVLGRLIVLKDETELNFFKSETSNSRRLFVYFPGILADGVKSSLNLVPQWNLAGDVLTVSYSGTRFIPNKVVKRVDGWITDHAASYDEIVFIGSSMGGLLSYESYFGVVNLHKIFKFILIDAPTKRSDFQAPLDKISAGTWAWWAGPISNTVSKLYFNATFRAPDEKNIEPGVDRDELAKRVEEAKSFPLSTHNDWIRYIMGWGRGDLIPGSLAGHDAVYLRSLRDTDTVRPEAFDSWNTVFGGELDRLEVDSTHVGYNERPEAWQGGFRRAFYLLGIH